MLTHPQSEPALSSEQLHPERNRYAGGIILILLGVFLLIGQVTSWNMSWLALAALAAIFLVWGLIVRTFGLVIPGSILAGIALGVALTGTVFPVIDGAHTSGVFLLSFAAGWGLMALLSVFTSGGFRWWPLIPGGILALVGLALLAGPNSLFLLTYASYLWPLVLIGVGIFILLRRR
jgi:uncharacterized membrane protein (DUF485 family)